MIEVGSSRSSSIVVAGSVVRVLRASTSVTLAPSWATRRPVTTRPLVVTAAYWRYGVADDRAGIDDVRQQRGVSSRADAGQVGSDLTPLAEQLVAGCTVLAEQLPAPRAVARPGAEVVVQAADLGQFLLRGAGLDPAPVLAHQGVELRVAVQRHWPQLIDGHLRRGDRRADRPSPERPGRSPAGRAGLAHPSSEDGGAFG